MVDDSGGTTGEEKTFRQALLTSLQKNFGDEGCVFPTQSSDNITLIQNNNYIDQATGLPVYTCQFGTGLYNSTANSMMFAIDDGTGKPVFKTVTLT